MSVQLLENNAKGFEASLDQTVDQHTCTQHKPLLTHRPLSLFLDVVVQISIVELSADFLNSILAKDAVFIFHFCHHTFS